MTNADAPHKITRAHRARKAVVYLRQSSLAQVRHNTESQRLQYALADTAKSYGFTCVEIIDRDLGVSAASGAPAREGFKALLASIALGEVGLVLSRELSRLSRSDQDWCHLAELCRLFDTLLGDAENVYDLSRLDDQLVLGIKGTLSVVELGTLKLRLQHGREAKARRGELGRCLAPGYVFDAAGCIVKDPNLRVQEAIERVFRKFNELGSIRQTYRWLHEEKLELPVNKSVGGRFVIAWRLPTMCFVGDLLHNPLYAGAYVYGRRPWEVVVKHGQTRKRQRTAVAAEQAKVFIPDHHEGYIAWDVYQRNQAIMRGNRGNFVADDAALAVRGGQGLLAGLLRCSRCGHKLHIRYWGKSGTAARYLCGGDFATGGAYCISFAGATVDKRLGELLLSIVSPHGLEASLAAIARVDTQGNDRHAALERQLQQVRYEAERSFVQYDQADPNNRLVADVLEQRWNAKLEEQRRLERELDALREATAALDEDEVHTIHALGENFPAVWNDPRCPMTLKKRIARTLIEEIMVDVDANARELHMVVHWHGGCHTAFTMAKPQAGGVAHKTALEDVELIARMAPRYRDDEIARVLSKLGRRTGKGNRWTQARVATVRRKHAIAPPDVAALDPDLVTLGKATELSGVSDTTLMRLINANILPAAQIAPYAQLEIQRADLDREPVAGILRRLKETGKLLLDAVPPGEQASLFESNQ